MASTCCRWQEQAGEREMAKEVGRQLHLEAIAGYAALRRRHDRGVVDQHIQHLALGIQTLGQAAHRSQVGQIQLFETHACIRHLGTNTFDAFGAALCIARGDDHLRPSPAQGQGILEAHTTGAAGDQHALASQRRHVACLPSR